jgi:two-component system sensor histidine kinase UhpB
MLKALRPHGLHASGLAQTLGELVQGWRGRHTEIAFLLDLPRTMPATGDAVALAIYRVVQEALTNVVRHSGARHCTVRLMAGAASLALEVNEDDADHGSTSAPCSDTGAGWHGGLLGMRERVSMVGGELHALPNPSGGLRLYALLPLNAVAAPVSEHGAEVLP